MCQQGIEPKKVILIARPVHQRRAYATFKKQHADVSFINAPGDEVYHVDNELIERLVGELKRLQEYAEKGDLEPQRFDEQIIEAMHVLTKEGKSL